MKLLIFALVVVFVLVRNTVEQHIAPGSCPEDREVVENFDLHRYTGRWYEIQRYDQPYEKGGDCCYAIYTLNANIPNSINIQNTMRTLADGQRTTTYGVGVLSFSAEEPVGKLNVTFRPDVPADKSNYWILSTDYTDYAIVYGCRNLNDSYVAESAWILARTTTLSGESKQAVDSVIAKYFDESALRDTVHDADACGY